MKNFIFLPALTLKDCQVALPGSKSISNRTLLLAALSDNACHVQDLLASDDTHYMLEALKKLGIVINDTQANNIAIQGNAGKFAQTQADLFLGNAGTAFRPLTAALALMQGHYQLSGVERMHERPIGDLVDALRLAGAQVEYLGQTGYPPLKISPFTNNGCHSLSVKGNVSSQFLTALLMALPLTGEAYTIHVDGDLISKPYIDITLNLLAQFGVAVTNNQYQSFQLPASAHYHAPATIHVEGDASSASYFLAAGLLSGRKVRVTGVGKHSIQGDVAFAHALETMGATIVWGDNFIEASRAPEQKVLPFDIDANHIPDAAMTLAIVALATDKPCTIRNIASWRVKETDRLHAMATELGKLGVQVIEGEDFIQIHKTKSLTRNVRIDTYDDHRMAMCFSLVSLLGTPIIINEPECVGKTFPDYFKVLSGLTA